MTFVPSTTDADAVRAVTIVSSMRRRWIVCAPLLVLAACSGGDESASTTAPAATVASAPPTTTPPATDPPATDPPASTAAPTTEAPATTAAPTTEPPTTTATPVETTPPDTAGTESTTTLSVDEEVQARLDVLDQVEASWPAVRAVYEDPFNEALVSELDQFFAETALEGLNNVVQQFRDGNFRTVARDGQPEIYEADPRSLTVNLEAGRATVQACHVNTSILLETAGNPDGSDRIARDEITVKIEELDLRLIDGVWKVVAARTPETEMSPCP